MAIYLQIILGILVLAALYLVVVYNSLIRLRNQTKEAFSDIDVQLKRRYDLIPNLINTVKGYAAHEKEVFEKVTEARTRALAAQTMVEKEQADRGLVGALKSLFAVTEAYPELKANENFLELQRELSDTENKIQAARRFYNGNVRDFNIKQEVFPSNLIAQFFGFQKAEFFELEEEGERERPVVNL